MAKTAKDVDEYLSALDAASRKTLQQVRRVIRSVSPKIEEKISYRVPFYSYKGHLLALIAQKKHNSFVTMSYGVIKEMKSELKQYKISGTTIHFPHDKALPSALVKKIVKSRMKENEQKAKLHGGRKSKT